MKIRISLIALLISLFASAAIAGDATYRASMKGIDCNGCKKSIAQSLGKISGVKTIRISKSGPNRHTVTVIASDSTSISKSDANSALGKDRHHSYTLLSWSRVR